MKSSNVYTSMPSLVSSSKNEKNVDFAGNLLNANLFLEMSKTAKLLSNQLLQLHQNLSLTNNNNNKSIDLTPISSGYNSLCASTDNLIMTLANKTSSHDSFSVQEIAGAKRRLFNKNDFSSSSSSSSLSSMSLLSSSSISDKSLDTSDSSISLKQFKPDDNKEEEDETTLFNFKTPHKTNSTRPIVPRIKDSRKKAKKLTNFNSFKLRRAYLKTNSD